MPYIGKKMKVELEREVMRVSVLYPFLSRSQIRNKAIESLKKKTPLTDNRKPETIRAKCKQQFKNRSMEHTTSPKQLLKKSNETPSSTLRKPAKDVGRSESRFMDFSDTTYDADEESDREGYLSDKPGARLYERSHVKMKPRKLATLSDFVFKESPISDTKKKGRVQAGSITRRTLDMKTPTEATDHNQDGNRKSASQLFDEITAPKECSQQSVGRKVSVAMPIMSSSSNTGVQSVIYDSHDASTSKPQMQSAVPVDMKSSKKTNKSSQAQRTIRIQRTPVDEESDSRKTGPSSSNYFDSDEGKSYSPQIVPETQEYDDEYNKQMSTVTTVATKKVTLTENRPTSESRLATRLADPYEDDDYNDSISITVKQNPQVILKTFKTFQPAEKGSLKGNANNNQIKSSFTVRDVSTKRAQPTAEITLEFPKENYNLKTPVSNSVKKRPATTQPKKLEHSKSLADQNKTRIAKTPNKKCDDNVHVEDVQPERCNTLRNKTAVQSPETENVSQDSNQPFATIGIVDNSESEDIPGNKRSAILLRYDRNDMEDFRKKPNLQPQTKGCKTAERKKTPQTKFPLKVIAKNPCSILPTNDRPKDRSENEHVTEKDAGVIQTGRTPIGINDASKVSFKDQACSTDDLLSREKHQCMVSREVQTDHLLEDKLPRHVTTSVGVQTESGTIEKETKGQQTITVETRSTGIQTEEQVTNEEKKNKTQKDVTTQTVVVEVTSSTVKACKATQTQDVGQETRNALPRFGLINATDILSYDSTRRDYASKGLEGNKQLVDTTKTALENKTMTVPKVQSREINVTNDGNVNAREKCEQLVMQILQSMQFWKGRFSRSHEAVLEESDWEGATTQTARSRDDDEEVSSVCSHASETSVDSKDKDEKMECDSTPENQPWEDRVNLESEVEGVDVFSDVSILDDDRAIDNMWRSFEMDLDALLPSESEKFMPLEEPPTKKSKPFDCKAHECESGNPQFLGSESNENGGFLCKLFDSPPKSIQRKLTHFNNDISNFGGLF